MAYQKLNLLTITVTECEMFEKSFERPSNFFQLSDEERWEIDKRLGILDWSGEGLSDADKQRFRQHYNTKGTT